jgi:uncharacterized protein (DUF1810 family)
MSTEFTCPVINTDRTLNDFSEFYSNSNSEYATALKEIKAGRKSSHWIWYIFPQLALHGHSGMAVYFGIKSLPEGRLYLQDPVLGPRLVEITEAALVWLRKGTNINRLMGSSVDASKLLSCATLFHFASIGTTHHGLFEELKLKCEAALGTQDTKSEHFCIQSIPAGELEVAAEK